MRFILGIDAGRFPGQEIERSLRPYCDIGEYDIMPFWEHGPSVLSETPLAIQRRAEDLLEKLNRRAEAAQYYISFTRGFYLYSKPSSDAMRLIGVCLDYAIATDRLKTKVVRTCLNPICISLRISSHKYPMSNDTETLGSLTKLVNTFCTLEEADKASK